MVAYCQVTQKKSLLSGKVVPHEILRIVFNQQGLIQTSPMLHFLFPALQYFKLFVLHTCAVVYLSWLCNINIADVSYYNVFLLM